jgi:hypothetical protein
VLGSQLVRKGDVELVAKLWEKAREGVEDWVLRRLPTCKEITPWMSDSLEFRPPLRRRMILMIHLWVCRWCVRYMKQIRMLREVVRVHPLHVEAEVVPPRASLSLEARDRIKRALRKIQ